jgi:hypothetical protein
MSEANAKGRKAKYGSPGIKGAIKDAVNAVSEAIAPPAWKGEARRRAYDDQVNGTARERQSTDSNN